jgi:HEAT repeat protein
MSMPELRMREGDYQALAELEQAFEGKDLDHFINLLEKSKGLPLLLRVHAVCMLEHIGNEDVVRPLCSVLREDPSPLTRHEAAFTLGQLGYRTAVPSLIEAMINDKSPIVRHESAVALSSIGDDSALPQLEKAIEDKDEDVSNSALIAFEYLSYLRRKRNVSVEKTALKPKIRL